MQNEATQKALNTQQNEVQIWQEIYRRVGSCVSHCPRKRIKDIEPCGVSVGSSGSVASADLFHVALFKIMAQEGSVGGRNRALIGTCIDESVGSLAQTCMRVDNADLKGWAVDPVMQCERTIS